MSLTYTYVHNRNNKYFKYNYNTQNAMKIINDNFINLLTAHKIAYAIKNYPARKSFYFTNLENMENIAKDLIKELGKDNCEKITVYFNDIFITYLGNKFEITRNYSNIHQWNSYEIIKI